MAKRQKKSLLSTVADDKIESKEEILKELKESKRNLGESLKIIICMQHTKSRNDLQSAPATCDDKLQRFKKTIP